MDEQQREKLIEIWAYYLCSAINTHDFKAEKIVFAIEKAKQEMVKEIINFIVAHNIANDGYYYTLVEILEKKYLKEG